MPTTYDLTRSLPPIELDLKVLMDLDLELSDIDELMLAASAVGHTIRQGNKLVCDQLELEPGSLPVLTLEQLSLVLDDAVLTAAVQSYASATLTREVVRDCREILSDLRLYWFDYHTLYTLWMHCDGQHRQDMTAMMAALHALGQAVEGKAEFKDLLDALGAEPRRDAQNNNCLVFNQLQLTRIIDDPRGVMSIRIWGDQPEPEVARGVYLLRTMLSKLREITT